MGKGLLRTQVRALEESREMVAATLCERSRQHSLRKRVHAN
jgi:hypothetical protein